MNEEIFLKQPGQEVGDLREHDVELQLEPFDLHGRHHEIERAKAQVSVTTLDNGLYLRLTVRADVKTTCDRTLEEVVLPLEFEDSELLSEPENEDFSVRDWTLDAKEYADRALPSEVPMQVFAPGSEPVKPSGDGSETEIDSRWKGLEGLFSIAL